MNTSQVLQRTAAACTAGAAFIHFGVAGEHFAEWWLYGVFFLALAAWQVIWAVLCWPSPHRRLLLAGAVVNVGVVVLWVVTRTSGLPFGPTPGTPEAVGVPDVLCAALELISAGLVVAVLLWRSATTTPWRARSATLVTAAVAALVLVTSGVAIADPGHSPSAGSAMAMSDSGTSGSPGSAGLKSTGNGDRRDLSQLPDVSRATAAQTTAARDFLETTIADTAKYRDPAAATAAGFDIQAAVQRHDAKHPASVGKPIKDLHVPNKANRTNHTLLDPAAPQTLIYNRDKAGAFTLIGVMYTAGKKAPPARYQPYVRWHYHELCKAAGSVKAAATPMPKDGSCPAGSTPLKTGYMTHVWFVSSSALVYGFAMSPPEAQLKAYQATLH